LTTEFFADEPGSLTDQTALLSEGIIDSLSVMVLVQFIETSFSFEFEPHEVDPDNLDSIDKMVAFIQAKIS
jgi:acyl carrier protein